MVGIRSRALRPRGLAVGRRGSGRAGSLQLGGIPVCARGGWCVWQQQRGVCVRVGGALAPWIDSPNCWDPLRRRGEVNLASAGSLPSRPGGPTGRGRARSAAVPFLPPGRRRRRLSGLMSSDQVSPEGGPPVFTASRHSPPSRLPRPQLMPLIIPSWAEGSGGGLAGGAA